MEENKVIDVTPEIEATPEVKYLNIVVEGNDRKYIFSIPDGSPIGESYDAAYKVLLKINEFANQSAAKMERSQTEVTSEDKSELAEEPKE